MARRSGAEGWILKPLDPIRLRKAVAALLAGGHLARHQLPAGSRGCSVPVVRAELAAAVREGHVDPVSLVEESLRRIESHNGVLNAITALRAEEALAEAAASPRQGQLAGLPGRGQGPGPLPGDGHHHGLADLRGRPTRRDPTMWSWPA